MASLPCGAPSLLAVLHANTAANQPPSFALHYHALHYHALVFALNLIITFILFVGDPLRALTEFLRY